MMFLGGVLMPLETLPGGLQIIARALPLTYAVEALRAALGQAPTSHALLDLAVLTAFTVVFFVLAARTLARKVG
jgi:ABC-2 type transport system permease protein